MHQHPTVGDGWVSKIRAGNSQVRYRGGRTGRAIGAGPCVGEVPAPLSEPRRTPLFDLHRELGGKMVPFAGWEMPVQYPTGILAEHQHCRVAAALLDVAAMGQVRLDGADAAVALERLVPGDIQSLAPGRARYTQFTNEAGGILDDLIVSQAADHLFLVVNAGCRDADVAHLRAALGPSVRVTELADRGLLALQGPQAVAVLTGLAPEAANLRFMSTAEMDVCGVRLPRLSAWATPARTGSRSPSPPTTPRNWRGGCWPMRR